MSPSRLTGSLLFAPIAAAAAYPAFLGGAALVAGLATGTDDVVFASDSGAPGFVFAVLGLLLLFAVAVLLYLGWLVAFDRASPAVLIVVLVLCLPALLLCVAALAQEGIHGLLSPLTMSAYVLALTLWRLSVRIGRRRTPEPSGGRPGV